MVKEIAYYYIKLHNRIVRTKIVINITRIFLNKKNAHT